jgi:rubredoxin
MERTHTCRNCGYHYEITIDEDYDIPDDGEEIMEPEYCPFCGTHHTHDD